MIDLFAGCGGMTAGFPVAGSRPVLRVEWNLHAAATYAANFGEDHTSTGATSTTFSRGDFPEADVVIGGPPAKASPTWKSRTSTIRATSSGRATCRSSSESHPKVFVIENVDRFKSSAEFQLLLDEAENGMLSDYELSHGRAAGR